MLNNLRNIGEYKNMTASQAQAQAQQEAMKLKVEKQLEMEEKISQLLQTETSDNIQYMIPNNYYTGNTCPCCGYCRDKEAKHSWVETKSEQEIKETYYPYWCEKMRKVGKGDLINFENCLDDWITINWAWEVKDE